MLLSVKCNTSKLGRRNQVRYWFGHENHEFSVFCFRYDEIEGKMTPFLKSSGYNVKKGIMLSY